MKHIKTYELFGLFKKTDADKYAQQVLDIIEKENIPISDFDKRATVIIDNNKYEFYTDEFDHPKHSVLKIIDEKGRIHILDISDSFYIKLRKIQERRIKQKNKEFNQKLKDELPDLSDTGRTAKKYNL